MLKTFRAKIFFTFVVSISIIMIITLGITIQYYNNNSFKTSVSYSENLLHSIGLNIDNQLINYMHLIDYRISNDLVKVFNEEKSYEYPHQYTLAVNEILLNYINLIAGIDNITIVDQSMRTFRAGNQADLSSILNGKMDIVDKLDGNDYWCSIKSPSSTNMVLCRKLYYFKNDYKSEFLGYIFIVFEKNILQDYLLKSKNFNEVFVIANSVGEIIDGSQQNEIGQNISKVYVPNKNENYIGSNNRKYKVLNSKSNFLNLNYLYIVNISDIEKTMMQRVLFIILIVFCCLLASLFVVQIISKQLTKPITKLSDSMVKVGNGDYSIYLEEKSNDEIRVLFESFSNMVKDLNYLVNTNLSMQISMKEAVIKAYENQINPHFLYNTLEVIRMMVVVGDYHSIEGVLIDLGEMLRYNLKDEKQVKITEEINNIERYFSILKIRHREKFDYEIVIPDEIGHYYTLKFILQPIIENAISHGLSAITREGRITIHAKKINDEIVFIIRDSGVGISKDVLEKLKCAIDLDGYDENHIGLRNVNKRIKLFYGQKFGININSEVGVFTEVWVHIQAQELPESDILEAN